MSQYYNRPIEFRVAKVFSNHMVLQREKNIHIFGEALPGTCVTVTLTHIDGTFHTAKSIAEGGKWLVVLPPQRAQADCKLTIEAKCCDEVQVSTEAENCASDAKRPEIAEFTDVVIGEVWLAGGQSNMELELQNCTGGQETLANDINPNVRFYYTPKEPYKNKHFYEVEDQTSWQTFDSENAKCWSAVGYYFAKQLSKDLDGVTVGVIGCNWGGTSASAWMSEEALAEDKDLATYLEDYHKACDGISIEEQEKAYDDYVVFHENWDKKCGEMYKENPNIQWSEVEAVLGKCQWPGPMNVKNPFRPTGLYDCMLQRVCPYSLRGVIYYQGESDDHKPRMYYKLFTRMIRQWREDFMDEELPFLITQLTMHRYQYDEDFKNWPIIREAQMDTYKTIKNTGIAVIIDRGAFNDIHPLDKLTVGERLELQALAHVYDKIEKKDVFGPIYKSCIYHEHELELCFEYAQDGFVVRNNPVDGGQFENAPAPVKVEDMPTGFELAGADRRFVPAKARIEGTRIFVSAPKITQPLYARYLWTNYAEVTLYGKNGLPVAPFRTSKHDEQDTKLGVAQIQQIMET